METIESWNSPHRGHESVLMLGIEKDLQITSTTFAKQLLRHLVPWKAFQREESMSWLCTKGLFEIVWVGQLTKEQCVTQTQTFCADLHVNIFVHFYSW